MEQLSEFVINNILLFGALLVVMVLLIKAELDHQVNKGLSLSPAKAIRVMNNNEDALILDIRPKADYKNGHIKGAKNTPLSELAGKIDSYMSYKDKPVVIYCNSGSTATGAIKQFKKAGFDQINNLEGGIVAWKDANLPLAKK